MRHAKACRISFCLCSIDFDGLRFLRQNATKYYALCSVTYRRGYAPLRTACLSCVFLVKSVLCTPQSLSSPSLGLFFLRNIIYFAICHTDQGCKATAWSVSHRIVRRSRLPIKIPQKKFYSEYTFLLVIIPQVWYN